MTNRHIDIDDIDNQPPRPNPSQVDDAARFSEQGSSFREDQNFSWRPDRETTFSNLLQRAGRSFRRSFDDAIPQEARKHFQASRREYLLAWRSLIDRAIEQVDAASASGRNTASSSRGTKTTRIEVEEIDI